MKRDMEIVRQILLEIEETGKCVIDLGESGNESVTMLTRPHNMAAVAFELKKRQITLAPELADQVKTKIYNYGLLVREGWVEEVNEWRIEGLSWNAHDFLDAMREDSRWNQIKRYVKGRGEDISTLPFSTLKVIGEKLLTDLMVSGGGG